MMASQTSTKIAAELAERWVNGHIDCFTLTEKIADELDKAFNEGIDAVRMKDFIDKIRGDR